MKKTIDNDGCIDENIHYPLTSYQKDVWLEQCLYPGLPIYNIGGYYDIYGAIDPPALQKAVDRLIADHDALRIRIRREEGEYCQYIAPELSYKVPYYDFSGSENSSRRCMDWMNQQFLQAFDDDNLFQFALIKESDDHYCFFVKTHHVITDGWGHSLIYRQLIDNYNRLLTGKNWEEDRKPSYTDFIAEDLSYRESESCRNDVEFWRRKYRDQPEPLLNRKPVAFGDIGAATLSGRRTLTVKRPLYNEIARLSAAEGCSAFHFILGALYVYFHKIYAKDEIVIGVPILNRRKDMHKQMVGHFANVIPLRVNPDRDASFRELMGLIKQELRDCYRRQRLPFGRIHQTIFEKNEAKSGLFEISLSYEKQDYDAGFTGTVSRAEPLTHQYERIALSLYVREFAETEDVDIDFDYQFAVFDENLPIEDTMKHFLNILGRVAADPTVRISAIDMLAAAERTRLIWEFNDTHAPFPEDRGVHHYVENFAKTNPDRTAVICGKENYSYRQLNQTANRIGRFLKKAGLKPEEPVAILLNRSPLLVAAILGIWKAGGAYIPLDLEYPAQRLRTILEDSGVKTVLTLAGQIPPELAELSGVRFIRTDPSGTELAAVSGANLNLPFNPGGLAYVIYTSGSTGKPKGAMIEHRGMMNHIAAEIAELEISGRSVVAQNASHCFDVSVWQFFASLTAGGKVVIYPNETVLDVREFTGRLRADGVTILEAVPSYLTAMLEYIKANAIRPEKLEYLLVTGETVSPGLVRQWFELNPGTKVVNAYGPAEAADDIAQYRMEAAPAQESVPIGKPIQNTHIYIVDRDLNLCPVGVKGEICVSGIGVGRGYLNDPEKTAQAFMEDPYRGEAGVRMYKTGDLGRWLPGGNLEFHGRRDYQVKIRGHRIELEEIEARLSEHPAVREAAVIDRANEAGEKYLCGYIALREEVAAETVREYLRQYLPEYMVPACLLTLESLPLSPNGKIDRKALPPVDFIAAHNDEVLPANEIEEKLQTLWEQILRRKNVGVDRNFFEIGGHSLNILALAAKLQETFRVDIPLIELMREATIRGMAEAINRHSPGTPEQQQEREQVMILLNGRKETHLFLFPPVFAYSLIYRELARRIDVASCYAFDFIEAGDRIDRYAGEIVRVQPEGPYRLLGYSAGGNLAFEVVRELERRGYAVSDLILLDSVIKTEKTALENGGEAELEAELRELEAELARNRYLKGYFRDNRLKEQLIKKTRSFQIYENDLINQGLVNSDIHLISSDGSDLEAFERSEKERFIRARRLWARYTTGRYFEHAGYGQHDRMLNGVHLNNNLEILKKILMNGKDDRVSNKSIVK